MTENQNQKFDELFLKIRALTQRVKTTRDSFGQPLVDRAMDRVTRISAKLPNNGHAVNQQPQQPPLKVCPKCGRPFFEDVSFCNCGFNFQEEQRRHQREEFEREKLERSAHMGVTF